MSDIKIELNSQGIKAILQSEEMKSEVERVANNERKSDTHVKSFIGYNRAKAFIYPNTKRNPQ